MKKKSLNTIALIVLLIMATACAAPSMLSSRGEYDEGVSVESFTVAPEEAPAAAVKSDYATNSADIERIVIKDAELNIYVANPAESMDRISSLAEDMGGYVVNANLYQTTLGSGAEVHRASIFIRIPAERLNEAIDRIKEETDQPIIRENVSSQDVTQEYTDQQSRLRALEAAEKQLLEIMDSATRAEDVLDIFNELTQVRQEIEVTKGQIRYFEQSAALSALRVELLPNEAAQPLSIGGWQPAGVAKDALQALISAGKFLVNALIWIVLFLLPTLIVIILPIYLIIRWIRNWRRRRKAKKAELTAE